MPFYGAQPVKSIWPLATWYHQAIFLLIGNVLILKHFSINPSDYCDLLKIPADQQVIKYCIETRIYCSHNQVTMPYLYLGCDCHPNVNIQKQRWLGNAFPLSEQKGRSWVGGTQSLLITQISHWNVFQESMDQWTGTSNGWGRHVRHVTHSPTDLANLLLSPYLLSKRH